MSTTKELAFMFYLCFYTVSKKLYKYTAKSQPH